MDGGGHAPLHVSICSTTDVIRLSVHVRRSDRRKRVVTNMVAYLLYAGNYAFTCTCSPGLRNANVVHDLLPRQIMPLSARQ